MNETLAAWTPRALSVLRIIAGLLIIQHGMGKIFGFPAYPMYANVQLMSLSGVAGIIELIGGALLIVGLWTQPVAFILVRRIGIRLFHRAHVQGGFTRCSTAARWRRCTASPSCTWRRRVRVRGASTLR